MHEVIQAAVDPTTALSVGLEGRRRGAAARRSSQGIQDGSISLTSPATTVALLKLNAVVGLKGTVETVDGTGHADARRASPARCATPPSTIRSRTGIGKRLDGWANRDLNPGAIIALSPALTADQKAVYNSWGKGKYDPRFNLDGMNGPQVIPPAYGLLGINRITVDRRRRRHRVLESLRRGHADGRARDVHRAAHGRRRDQRHATTW